MSAKAMIAAVLGGAALAVLVGASASQAGELRFKDMGAEVVSVAQSVDPQVNPSPLSLAPPPHRSLELDSKGRWGLRLDVDEPASRDQDFRDLQAGAYLRIGPRLRVGGSVGLGDRFAPTSGAKPQDAAPRVRLETKFKF